MHRRNSSNPVYSTYILLRAGLALMGFLFPVALWGIGKLVYGIDLETAMSAYYSSHLPNSSVPVVPMRVWFGGFLFSISTMVLLYKGFSSRENMALNAAGGFGVGVAVFPFDEQAFLHGACAFALFACLAYVSLICSKDTLEFVVDPKERANYRRIYNITALLMIASPVSALIVGLFFDQPKSYLFFLESAGVWSFSTYWMVKSHELWYSDGDYLFSRPKRVSRVRTLRPVEEPSQIR